MERINTTNKDVDLFGAGKHGFKDGDPVNGIFATFFAAAWCNTIQEELANTIEAAGIALDPNNRAQLLQALRGAGLFTTPAQFDNTTKAATTAFVKAHSGALAGFVGVDASTVFGLSDLGKCIQIGVSTPAGQIMALPASATVPPGYGYWISNLSGYPVTIKAAGVEVFQFYAAAPNSFLLNPGECIFASSQQGQWTVFGAISAQVFGSSLAGSGYQKLPSGLIIQWGTGTGSGSGPVTVTLPMVFPTAGRNLIVSVNSLSQRMCGGIFSSTSQIQVATYNQPLGSYAAEPFMYLAIGN
jgi:hypothetical protein